MKILSQKKIARDKRDQIIYNDYMAMMREGSMKMAALEVLTNRYGMPMSTVYTIIDRIAKRMEIE